MKYIIADLKEQCVELRAQSEANKKEFERLKAETKALRERIQRNA